MPDLVCDIRSFVYDAESPLMRDEKQPLGGAVVVTVDSGTAGRLDVEVLWAHTTDSMCLGYMSTTDLQAKVTNDGKSRQLYTHTTIAMIMS